MIVVSIRTDNDSWSIKGYSRGIVDDFAKLINFYGLDHIWLYSQNGTDRHITEILFTIVFQVPQHVYP